MTTHFEQQPGADFPAHQEFEPNNFPPTETLRPRRKSPFVLGGAALAAGAALTGVLFLGRGGDAEPARPAGAVSEPTTDSPTAQPTPENTASSPEVNESVQSNTVLGLLTPTSTDIKAVRPNEAGEILVPKLVATSPNEFMDSFLSLYACYMTTKSTECLDALNATPQVREGLIEDYSTYRVSELQPQFPFTQFEIYGSPTFSQAEVLPDPGEIGKKYRVELDMDGDSELFQALQLNEAAWQSHEIKSGEAQIYEYTRMVAEYLVADTGEISVTTYGFDFELQQ